MSTESSREVIERYIDDAIAAERNFETQLKAFSKEGEQAPVQRLFAEHAIETRHQHSDSPLVWKSWAEVPPC
jgi:ferritin-like metal-binding protein YciE